MPANQPTERMVGAVEVVREEAGFVLIRVRPGFGLPAGSLLEVRPEGREVIPLSVSPERGRSLVVADFAGGPPQVGDPVYQVLGPANAPGAAEPSDFVDMPPPEPLDTF